MTNKERIGLMSDSNFIFLASTCESKVELHKRLNIPYNGSGIKILNDKLKKTCAELKPKALKWKKIEKICPVCGTKFITKENHPREKIVCSHGCANTLLRSGEDNGNWKESSYRTTCFVYHKKQCVICGEELMVAVHHFDNDKNNNSSENLIPLCPTHHQYVHSKYYYIIKDRIIDYRNKFILGMEKEDVQNL